MWPGGTSTCWGRWGERGEALTCNTLNILRDLEETLASSLSSEGGLLVNAGIFKLSVRTVSTQRVLDSGGAEGAAGTEP